MALGPISYDALLTQPDFSGLGAIAQQIQQRRAVAEQKRQAQAQQAALDADIERLGANPDARAAMQFGLKYPKLAESAQKGLEAYSEERKQQNLQDMFGVASLLQADRFDQGLKLVGERKSALVASGEQVAQTEAVEELIEEARQAQARGDTEAADRAKNKALGIMKFGIGQALGEKAAPLLERLGFGGGSEGKVVG